MLRPEAPGPINATSPVSVSPDLRGTCQALDNTERDWACIYTGFILLVVPNRVLIIADDIETNYYRLNITSLEDMILDLMLIGRIGALKPYFKLRIVMRVSPPLEGTSLFALGRNRHLIGVGHCNYWTEWPVRLKFVWHNSLALWGERYAVKLARVGEADSVARRTYSIDAERRQFGLSKPNKLVSCRRVGFRLQYLPITGIFAKRFQVGKGLDLNGRGAPPKTDSQRS